MTLRTPRRRISPRAKRRYRLIRDFFRRALGERAHSRYTGTHQGNSSQQIKINSSIAVNVTNLKHKIVGIEHQLNEVSKHCQDLSQLEASFRREPAPPPPAARFELESEPSRGDPDNYSNTKVIYKPNEIRYRKSDESDYASNYNYQSSEDRKHNRSTGNVKTENHSEQFKYKKKKSKLGNRTESPESDPILQKHRAQSMLENVLAVTPTSSYHSLERARSTLPRVDAARERERDRDRPRDRDRDRAHDRARDRRHSRHHDYYEPALVDEADYKKPKKQKSRSPARFYDDKHTKSHRKKTESPKLDKIDQEFIADIIKKQYKAVKIIGRKHSDISQFSVPVCRDQEFILREDIQEGPELCSCCVEAESPHCAHSPDTRSLYEARAGAPRRPRPRGRHVDPYNDSTYYDVVPVKEKSSPKSRRKFVENEMVNDYYREVPPSPRTLKPRLNLKAQHFVDYEDHIATKYMNKISGVYKAQQEYFDSFESDVTSEIVMNKRRREKMKMLKPAKIQTSPPLHQDSATVCSLQDQTIASEHGGNDQLNVTANDCTLNKTQDTDASDKTDKALCEIKDILQNFLQEIKKEAAPPQQTSHTETEKQPPMVQEAPIGPTSMHAGMNNYSAAALAAAACLPTGFVPPFTNPCCYPVLPMCPVNCMQSSYVVPSRSFTCHSCANNTTKDIACQECAKQKKDTTESTDNIEKSNETDELIKEIYKYISKNPNKLPTRQEKKEMEEKVLTSRSVGSARLTKRYNARVGTSAMKCYSKSCEAIGSRANGPEAYTSVTQSDTILEKLSLEGTTQSDTEMSGTGFTVAKKSKKSKIANVLKSIVFLKKKKKDPEISETVSSLDMDLPKAAPFRQDYLANRADYYPHGRSPRFSPRMDPSYGGYGPPPAHMGYDNMEDPRHSNPYNRIDDPRSSTAYRTEPRSSTAYRTDPHSSTAYRTDPHSSTAYRTDPHSSNAYRMDDNRGPSPYSRMEEQMQYGPRYPAPSPYPSHYEPHYSRDKPTPPLCLKEVEVRSTGTQSERKGGKSFFQSLKKRPSALNEIPSAMATQTAQAQPQPQRSKNQSNAPTPTETAPKPSLFASWKKFQEKVQKDMQKETMMYGMKQSQRLAEGDKKVKKAMMKKLFMKRNPFSPNNLIMKALMGTDVAPSFEPPPQQMKLMSGAKMFLR